MTNISKRCCFEQYIERCKKDKSKLISASDARVQSIIRASKIRMDGLENWLDTENVKELHYHKNCVSTYTSKFHLKMTSSKETSNSKKVLRSETGNFDFDLHCLFCGYTCDQSITDPKNSQRWKEVSKCQNIKSVKVNILRVCDERNDDESDRVKMRIQGALSDLKAAKGQYHRDCRAKFMSKRNIEAAKCKQSSDESIEESLLKLVSFMEDQKKSLWSSIDLHELYDEYGGTSSRRVLISKLSDHFGEDLLILSGVGVASIIGFKKEAHKFVKYNTDCKDDVDVFVTKIAKQI